MDRSGEEGPRRSGPLRVGDWLVEPSLNRLAKNSKVVRVTPKAMDLLVFLARRAGEVLSRETIIDAVWAETFVGENVLRRQIAALRKALGDRAAHPTYLENIPRRGYRLIAEVAFLDRPGRSGSGHIPSAEGRFLCSLRWESDDLQLREGDNTIGRTPECDVQIASERVSRRHARIVVDRGRATIEDLGSKNGTFVGGLPIDSPTELVDGDRITIGPAVLQYSGFFTADTKADDDDDAAGADGKVGEVRRPS